MQIGIVGLGRMGAEYRPAADEAVAMRWWALTPRPDAVKALEGATGATVAGRTWSSPG